MRPKCRCAASFPLFSWSALIATALQYAVLVGLKELAHAPVIPASLTGYLAGGLLNYILNRRHTFDSDRSHAEAGWRFAAVMCVGFFLTWGFMRLFVNMLEAPYIPAQVVTSGLVLIWNFGAHRLWTFRAQPNA